MLRTIHHAVTALAAIIIQDGIVRCGSCYFRYATCCGMCHELHLPKPVACRNEALGEIKIHVIRCENMWNGQRIVDDGNAVLHAFERQRIGSARVVGFKVVPESFERTEKLAERRNG